MQKTYIYKIETPHKTVCAVVKTSNFHIRYLLCVRLCATAKKLNGKLTVKRLTLVMAIKFAVEFRILKLLKKDYQCVKN